MRPCACVCHRGLLRHAINEFCCINAVHVEHTPPAPGEHRPYIETRFGGFRALCDCGWRSDLINLRADAELELEAHERKTQPKTEPSIWDRAQ